MSAKTVLLILGLLAAASAIPKRYDGYKVLRVGQINKGKAAILSRLQDLPGVDFWTDIHFNGPTDIMVSPDTAEELEEYLRSHIIPFVVHIENVQTLIDAEQIARPKSSAPSPKITFTEYHGIDDIYSWLDDLADQYPDIASIQSIGSSYEGRDLKMIKISSGGSEKPSILIEGGIHAQEWIAPATVTYFISQLVENYNENRALVDNVDWYILPSLNPDGYEYSRTEDRMWKKTRSLNFAPIGCDGVNANRNFDFHWMEIGASNQTCSEEYAGATPFSEVEAQAFADLLNSINFNAYLSVHSYGQISLANDAVAALEAVNGTQYTTGSSMDLLSKASGCSADYAKGVAGVKYVYVIELRDAGDWGFMLPTDQILPTGEETWEAVKVIGNFVATK